MQGAEYVVATFEEKRHIHVFTESWGGPAAYNVRESTVTGPSGPPTHRSGTPAGAQLRISSMHRRTILL